MKNADDSKPSKNIVPDDSELGPEPEWLLDEVVEDSAPESEPPEGEQAGEPAPGDEDIQEPKAEPLVPVDDVGDLEPELSMEATEAEEAGPSPVDPAPPPPSPEEVAETTEFTSERLPVPVDAQVEETTSPEGTREHPWLWGLAPFIFLLATGLIAWFGTTQTLHGLTTWEAIREQSPPLLPARWAMTIWWLVLPLMTIFLIYGSLPAGREPTRIKYTGPLISIGLAATSVWIFAQHWHWDLIGIISMGIAALAILATYFMVALGSGIHSIRQRMISVIPLSAALGYSVMLTVLSWQSYSSQPFGERGASVLFTLLVVVAAALFAFFLRDGLFALVLAIWFAGVVHHQWGEDAVISLVAAVAVLFTGALAILGGILATESHKPALTTSVTNKRGRTSFFNKSENPEQ